MMISVVTVAFNSAKTIAATLDSVAAQTHPHIEHIIVDGGSTDGTLSIIRARGKSVTKLISEPDNGIYDAMNKGLRVADGTLVGFLNADDTYAQSDTLELIAEAARSNPQAAAVYGDLEYVSESDVNKVIRYWRSGDFSPSRLRFGWMAPHPTFYVRRDVIEQIGMFNEKLRIAADYEFMLRCLSSPAAQAAYVPQVLVRMRLGGASNRSISAIVRKSREDLQAIRANCIGGMFTLMCKNVRKVPQYLQGSKG